MLRRMWLLAGTEEFTPANSSAIVVFKAKHIFARVSTDGFARPRSIKEMNVRSTSASNANVSCDLLAAIRIALRLFPSAVLTALRFSVGVSSVMRQSCPLDAYITTVLILLIFAVYTHQMARDRGFESHVTHT